MRLPKLLAQSEEMLHLDPTRLGGRSDKALLISVPKPGSTGSAFLDGARGIAALVVVLGHAKLMLLQDARSLPEITVLQKAFYFWTNLGASAVMVFFVLSGFLVGGSVVRAIYRDAFDWRTYAIARASRLYTVLLPALVIGAAIDLLGTHFFGWASPYHQPHYGFMLPESIAGNINPGTFLGNLFFLQEVAVPTLGSNHPLWSLTNEGWYYVAFPLLALLVLGRDTGMRKMLLGVALALVLILLPSEVSLLGIVWLMGAVVAALPRRDLPWWTAVGACALFALCLIAASAGVIKGLAKDCLSGAVFAFLIYSSLPHMEGAAGPLLRRISGYLSNVSYTLYLVHMPMLVFVAALIVGEGERFSPTLASCSMVIALLMLSLVYASLIWVGFERNTPAVRKFLSRAMS
ncbi:acyltransferase [Bradyrhizobium symbiodeficiens]|uniref:acyltransferase family protein n=1 Tax=Bradyrhizobium symbiodeficiens TaxID=1404367 RepID=UPI0030D47FEB